MPKHTKEQLDLAIHEVVVLGHSLKGAARRNSVPKSTLSKRVKGTTKCRSESHEAYQRLSIVQEKLLVSWIVLQGALGLTPTHQQITALVVKLLRDQGDHEPLGKGWIVRFIERHEPIKRLRGRKSGANRSSAVAPEAVQVLYQIISNPAFINSRPENNYESINEANDASEVTGMGANEVTEIDEDEAESESTTGNIIDVNGILQTPEQ